jgi:hypothetical protein
LAGEGDDLGKGRIIPVSSYSVEKPESMNSDNLDNGLRRRDRRSPGYFELFD